MFKQIVNGNLSEAAAIRAARAVSNHGRARGAAFGRHPAHQYRPVPPMTSVNTPSSKLIPTMMRI